MRWLRVACLLAVASAGSLAQLGLQSYLGLTLATSPDRAGVVVRGVMPNGPAARAGLQVGDILVLYNDRSIADSHVLADYVRATPIGSKVRIDLWRAGKHQSSTLLTGAKPATPVAVFPPEVPVAIVAWQSLELGVESEDLNSQLAEALGVSHGVFIRSVEKGSLAENAGLKAGDVVLACGNVSVNSPHDLAMSLQAEVRQSETPHLKIVRQRRPVELTLHFGY